MSHNKKDALAFRATVKLAYFVNRHRFLLLLLVFIVAAWPLWLPTFVPIRITEAQTTRIVGNTVIIEGRTLRLLPCKFESGKFFLLAHTKPPVSVQLFDPTPTGNLAGLFVWRAIDAAFKLPIGFVASDLDKAALKMEMVYKCSQIGNLGVYRKNLSITTNLPKRSSS